MSLLVTLYASLLRIILLLIGVLIALSIGIGGYSTVNNFLLSQHYPCVELISSLVIIVPVVAVFYGQHIKRFFWRRMDQYDLTILVMSFILGVFLTLLPLITPSLIPSQLTHCIQPTDVIALVTHMLATGILIALLAFIGVDLGVILKHISLKLTHHIERPTKKKPRRR